MKNFLISFAILMTVSTASGADSLADIYQKYGDADNYYWIYKSNPSYGNQDSPGAGSIHKVEVYGAYGTDTSKWNVVLKDENNNILIVLRSDKADGWEGLYAVMRNSGYIRAFERIEEYLKTEQGNGFTHSDFTFTHNDGGWFNTTASGTAQWSWNGSYTASLSGSITFTTPNGENVTLSDSYIKTAYNLDTAVDAALEVALDIADQAFEAGYNVGYDDGYEDGYEDGFVDGYNAAWNDIEKDIYVGNPLNQD